MKMAAFKAIAIAAVCLILATPSSAYYSMEDMCAQWSGTGYIGNPTDCQGWGYCKGQKIVSSGKCGTNLVYDPQTSSCQRNTDVPCFNNIKQTCAVYTGFMEDPNNCQKYAYCWPNGTAAALSCPSGQTYATASTTCVWGPACQQDSICRFMPNNIFVGDPSICGNYIQCVNGYGESQKCPTKAGGPALYFNAAAGVCQTTTACTGTSNPGTPSGNNPSVTCTNMKPVGTATVGYVADPDSCYGYYYCATTTSKAVWGSCSQGLQFDSKTQECVLPLSIVCTNNRCLNTNMTFATVAGTSCKMYQYCGSATALPAFCPTNSPYFDERQQNCVGELADTYPICGAVPAPGST